MVADVYQVMCVLTPSNVLKTISVKKRRRWILQRSHTDSTGGLSEQLKYIKNLLRISEHRF